ncbi:Glutathione-dependent formaldehyde-activating enzyme [Grimontia celer]|uniref:Glutathione-dependent formaldehyde-activating enzyme n=1 Tax=Grimontia celer TaxID=1796497 RepID=A0A128F5X6_9GAMM|nr:GFA family protein [Grimontia celer]CZF81794.1 Glutathione-dependent formaldehyde-activating enzyme [Grimontia celer]
MKYTGSCHCGSVTFEFEEQEIKSGLRCNCSVCQKKGALMSAFTVSPEAMNINAAEGALATYSFGSGTAKHHFCSRCGIYPFHQTLRKPGHYRVNLGCLEGVDTTKLPFDVFDGASL